MTVCAIRTRWRSPWLRHTVLGGAMAAGAMLSGGCSGTLEDVLPEREPAYKSSRGTSSLEVPPDLASLSTRDSIEVPDAETTYSRYAGDGGSARPAMAVLPGVEGARIERSGDERWLAVTAEPEAVWSRIRDFWIGQGFTLETEEPAVGVMETNWAERRTPLPPGAITGLLNKLSDAFYGVAVRDRYRTRIERGSDSGVTEIYISHRGAEQMVVGNDSPTARPDDVGERVWQPRPSDPGLEAEMLTRLMISLGADEQQAEALATASTTRESRAHIERSEDGAASLMLDEEFPRAWRRTGLALDRAGFTVEDRDRSLGIFFVRYADPDAERGEAGWLSRLKFWSDDDVQEADTYIIRLSGGEARVRIVVLDRDGKPEESPVAAQILSMLHDRLR